MRGHAQPCANSDHTGATHAIDQHGMALSQFIRMNVKMRLNKTGASFGKRAVVR